MVKKRWFRFHIDRWLNGTFGMKPNEIAAYITVLCALYDNDGFVMLDCEVMARRCGMRPSSFQKAIDTLVKRGKLDIQAGYLTNKTVSDEILEREKLRQKSAETRTKLVQNSPDFSMKTTKEGDLYPHKQNTEYRITDRASLTGGACGTSGGDERVTLHPAVEGLLTRQKARKS